MKENKRIAGNQEFGSSFAENFKFDIFSQNTIYILVLEHYISFSKSET